VLHSKVDACIDFYAVAEHIIAGLHFKLQ